MKNNQEKYRILLFDLIKNIPLLYDLFKQLAQLYPQVYLSAGIIRNTVWASLHDQTFDLEYHEVDVIYYDPMEKENHLQRSLQQDLERLFPKQYWDVVNQAIVHQWYRTKNGEKIQPLHSIEHALSLWPETATAIAVRLNQAGEFELIAPFGLHDLFELKLRWNPALVCYTTFQERVMSKKWLQQWPKLRLLDP